MPDTPSSASSPAPQNILPYGSWPSPVNSQDLVTDSVRLGEPRLHQGNIYWTEGRPQEKGRSVLMRRTTNGTLQEALPKHCNVRSKAHEYGGASYCVTDQAIYFVEAADQRVYRFSEGDDKPTAITPQGDFRYADLNHDANRSRLYAVREDHRHKASEGEERNELIAINTNIQDPETAVALIHSGHSFYSNPELSPNGSQLCWLTWDHPQMPWDSTQLWLADISDAGDVTNIRCVAGGDQTGKTDNTGKTDSAGKMNNPESLFQPQWSPSGELFVVSDRNNWWNLHRLTAQGLEPLLTMDAEFATPQWVFGMSCYAFLNASTIAACYSQNGYWQLGTIDLTSGELTPIENPYCDISSLRAENEQLVMLAAGADSFSTLTHWNAATGFSPIKASAAAALNPTDISHAQAITFDTTEGQQAHGFYYAPTHSQYTGPASEKSPLIVLGHGGPTGTAETGLNLKIQYWTTRGFAVMDVNYRGSTGYGRQFRQLLHKNWGIRDVADVCAAADHLVKEGLADPERLAIKGSSAGGYTVLAALTFADTFKAGTSLYGIGDLETLANDTHKFEARYLDSLVGDYPAEKALYLERSPINHAAQLNCPVIFFQGLDDKVVPPNQAEAMVAELDKKNVPVAYVPFPGEGHGFRQAAAITRSIDGELSFYAQVFGFALSEQDQTIEPVTINNLPSADGMVNH